jgi:hypothetical protein
MAPRRYGRIVNLGNVGDGAHATTDKSMAISSYVPDEESSVCL